MLSSIQSPTRPASSSGQNIFVVADDKNTMAILHEALSSANMGDVVTATFAQVERGVDWALVTLVLMFPTSSRQSFDLISKIRASWLASSVPVILVSGESGSAEIFMNLEMGFDVVVPASTDPSVVVQYAKSLLRRRAILVEQSPLTEMPGVSVFRSVVESHIAMRRSVAVCRLDIDRLKSVVDRYGFARGSDMISALANVLGAVASRIRPQPFVAHVGGDDFLALCQPRLLRVFTARVTVLFEQAADKIYDPDDLRHGYAELLNRRQEVVRAALATLSTGVVVLSQRRKVRYDDLIQAANEMLSVAKSQPGSYVALLRNPAWEG
ncbi:diguanylate cyclase domain-containing protein [Micromonospora chalcea]|uniref:diguanylate cyclase domain-containing protein n=1 Tax=Micromonospora chalcea TaxID=1874 RepID=UPI003D73CB48